MICLFTYKHLLLHRLHIYKYILYIHIWITTPYLHDSKKQITIATYPSGDQRLEEALTMNISTGFNTTVASSNWHLIWRWVVLMVGMELGKANNIKMLQQLQNGQFGWNIKDMQVARVSEEDHVKRKDVKGRCCCERSGFRSYLRTCLSLEQQGCCLQVYLFPIQWTLEKKNLHTRSINHKIWILSTIILPFHLSFGGPLWDFQWFFTYLPVASKISNQNRSQPLAFLPATSLGGRYSLSSGSETASCPSGLSGVSCSFIRARELMDFGWWVVLLWHWCCCHCKRRSRTGFMLMLAGKSCWQEMTYTCCSCKIA